MLSDGSQGWRRSTAQCARMWAPAALRTGGRFLVGGTWTYGPVVGALRELGQSQGVQTGARGHGVTRDGMVGRKTRVFRKSVKEQGGWGCAVCLPMAPGCTRGLGMWQQAPRKATYS